MISVVSEVTSVTATASAVSTTRTAPDSATVTVAVPEELGRHQWFASTKFASRRGVRQFTLAPIGQHQVIPRKILPEARKNTWQRRGHDIIVFEAKDRSNSCLLFVGPYHEATTWFGGPAPDEQGLTALLNAVEFTDSAQGATLRSRSPQYIKPFGTMLVASGSDSLLMIRSASDGLSSLPEWSGHQLAHGELWRAARALPEEQMSPLQGTPQQWRYIWANPRCVVDVILDPHQENSAAFASLDVVSVFRRFQAEWSSGEGGS